MKFTELQRKPIIMKCSYENILKILIHQYMCEFFSALNKTQQRATAGILRKLQVQRMFQISTSNYVTAKYPLHRLQTKSQHSAFIIKENVKFFFIVSENIKKFPFNSIHIPFGNPWTLEQVRIPASTLILLYVASPLQYLLKDSKGERERREGR